ncbi:MAG TPA: DUF2190 family protein [Rhodanobacter sp.]|nr:DUF2190 family protein [Rhodanobacter sp.]
MGLQLRSPASQIKTLQATATAATNAHVPVAINGHILIPTDYALANAINGYVYESEISDAPKAAVAWGIGDALYWDATAGAVTNVATSNTAIGRALAPALAGDATTGLVAFNAFAS